MNGSTVHSLGEEWFNSSWSGGGLTVHVLGGGATFRCLGVFNTVHGPGDQQFIVWGEWWVNSSRSGGWINTSGAGMDQQFTFLEGGEGLTVHGPRWTNPPLPPP